MTLPRERQSNKFDVMALTVDNNMRKSRKRFKNWFYISPKLTLSSLFSFATKPMWGNKLFNKRQI